MGLLAKYRVLISGVFSPIAAVFLYAIVYGTLTAHSKDVEQDWLFRLSAATCAMVLPFVLTLVLALRDSRFRSLSLSARVGLAFAILSLGLAWRPVHDGILRSRQTQNMALHDVAAPPFETPDLNGQTQRLADQKGKVVLINIWATWCGPCRIEMPKLDQLYQTRKQQGFVVFGLSDEDVAVQQKFLQRVPVAYPLLTVSPGVPHFYRDISRYPAIFLIDRQGRLQPAPGPEQPFDKVESAVDTLLHNPQAATPH